MKLFWVTTHALVTRPSGDRMNIGFIVRAPYGSVDEFVTALQREPIIRVERIDTKKDEKGRRFETGRSVMGLTAGAVATLASYTGDFDNA